MTRLRLHFQPIDGLLLLMTAIWGGNFTVVKVAVRHIPELPFNALRLLVASAAFLITLWARERLPRLTRKEWLRVGALALVGHVIYQVMFLGAVARTTVANSSLIFAFTPITVALLTARLGHEQVPVARWVGAAISLVGIYLVVGSGRTAAGATLLGDLLGAGAMLCWALYTVGARPLLARRSAMVVTGYSMAIGSVLYLPLAGPDLLALDWGSVPMAAWAAVVASALLALFVAYMIWYTAVQRIGSTRTAVYSNVTPLAAIAVAALFLDEPLSARKLAGAAAVIVGVAVSRLERRTLPPAEA